MCFGQFLCPSSEAFHCTHSNGICHTGLLTACSQAVSKHIPLLCVRWKTPDDGQRNCPKHVEFYFKNKFEKLVHLGGFIIRIYHDTRSPECQILKFNYISYFNSLHLVLLHLQISLCNIITLKSTCIGIRVSIRRAQVKVGLRLERRYSQR